MKRTDEYYMKAALREAKKAKDINEVPIGAVIVLDGKIIARGHNKRESTNDPTTHAEIIAIRKASKKLNNWRLVNCEIYVTIEPCLMCMGAIINSRISSVIYGANDAKGGAITSSLNINEVRNLNHYPLIRGPVLEDECKAIITSFFKEKRKIS
jgi:tRNA(adenine34) deaminase